MKDDFMSMLTDMSEHPNIPEVELPPIEVPVVNYNVNDVHEVGVDYSNIKNTDNIMLANLHELLMISVDSARRDTNPRMIQQANELIKTMHEINRTRLNVHDRALDIQLKQDKLNKPQIKEVVSDYLSPSELIEDKEYD